MLECARGDYHSPAARFGRIVFWQVVGDGDPTCFKLVFPYSKLWDSYSIILDNTPDGSLDLDGIVSWLLGAVE